MPFDARSLRVQLPCGPVTVIEAAAHDAELLAREYWRDRFRLVADDACGNCSPVTDRCIGRSERGREAILCAGTEPLSILTTVDVSVLPVLRRQLEAQLKEIQIAEEAVAKKTATSK